MKKLNRVLNLILAAALSLAAVSCSKAEWFDSYEDAFAAAEKKDKGVILVITGCDWNAESKLFLEQVARTEEFENAFKKDFIFVNIDFSQQSFLRSNVMEDSTEEEKEESRKIIEDYESKQVIADRYAVAAFPSLYFVTKEGWYLSNVSVNETAIPLTEEETKAADENEKKGPSVKFTPETFLASVNNDEINQKNEITKKIRSSEGTEKARYIDQFFDMTNPMYASSIEELVRSFPTLDPNNETGFVDKYRSNIVYFDAYDELRSGRDPALVFEAAAQDSSYDVQTRQNFYSMAGFMVIRIGSENDSYDFDRILNYLEKAYNLDSETPGAEEILQQITTVRQYREFVSGNKKDATEW